MINRRRVGGDYERQIRLEFIELGWADCQTSRYASREMDDANVDLVNIPPFNVQCKRWKSAPSYHEVLKSMPKNDYYNVIFHKRPGKGEIVVLNKDSFYELILMLKREKII